MKSLIIQDNNNGNNQHIIDEINTLLKNGKNIFLFTYMDGCGPCNSTIPEWDNIPDKIKGHVDHNNDVFTVRINKDLFPLLKNMGSEPGGFPSLRHVTNKQVEEFENWQTPDGSIRDRSTDSFIKWIEDKISKKKGVKKQPMRTRKNKRKQRGGKWSLKYKRSINCKRPRGFSQRQHCKYGRKKST
uniref:Thioredoxin domain-containing protein n=1 Tax=viral metagenome TaxID=1070528 RepID=A0A6C0H9R6_9ZZZZ